MNEGGHGLWDGWQEVEGEFGKVLERVFGGGEGGVIVTEGDEMVGRGMEVEGGGVVVE